MTGVRSQKSHTITSPIVIYTTPRDVQIFLKPPVVLDVRTPPDVQIWLPPTCADLRNPPRCADMINPPTCVDGKKERTILWLGLVGLGLVLGHVGLGLGLALQGMELGWVGLLLGPHTTQPEAPPRDPLVFPSTNCFRARPQRFC